MMVTTSSSSQIQQFVQYFDLTHGLPAPGQLHFRLTNLMLHQLPHTIRTMLHDCLALIAKCKVKTVCVVDAYYRFRRDTPPNALATAIHRHWGDIKQRPPERWWAMLEAATVDRELVFGDDNFRWLYWVHKKHLDRVHRKSTSNETTKTDMCATDRRSSSGELILRAGHCRQLRRIFITNHSRRITTPRSITNTLTSITSTIEWIKETDVIDEKHGPCRTRTSSGFAA